MKEIVRKLVRKNNPKLKLKPKPKLDSDIREQLYNEGEKGPASEIQVSRERIYRLHGFMLDMDPGELKIRSPIGVVYRRDVTKFHKKTVRKLLKRIPLLNKARVVSTGTGLHLILVFREPVELDSDSKRDLVEAISEIVRVALPIDPDQPGITALTRPIGSVNSKNNAKVKLLCKGEPVTLEEVEQFAQEIAAAPFATIAPILLGDQAVSPCPICGEEGSRLTALDHVGQCYGHCGKVTLEALWDSIYEPRSGGPDQPSRAVTMVKRLRKATRALELALVPGCEQRQVIRGITRGGDVIGQYDAKLAEVTELLRKDGRFYRWGECVVVERGTAERLSLFKLADGSSISPLAVPMLTGVVICEGAKDDDGGQKQYQIPPKVTGALLHRHATREALPEIKSYFRRPIVDQGFVLRGPGWHPDVGILVHSRAIEPAELGPTPSTSLPILDRLPPNLRRLLQDFCFRTDADLVAAVAALLTAVLVNHFVTDGKPVFLIDGNQPSIGKSLLATAFGIIADGRMPTLIAFTPDNAELEKRIVANVRQQDRSVLVIDNAKTRSGSEVNSAALESMSVAPVISGRILGLTETFNRPNDVLWAVTMNDTRASHDLVSRACPIRLYFDGDPDKRPFDGRSVLDFVERNREQILAELYGCIYRWTEAGRPKGARLHRFRQWAEIVGGILLTNGLAEFLDNIDEAAAEFDASRDELSALAEAVADNVGGPKVFVIGDAQPSLDDIMKRAAAPLDWYRYFARAGLEEEKLESSKSAQSKRTVIGNVLSRHVGRLVRLERKSGTIDAVLRCYESTGRRKAYYFEFRRIGDQDAATLVPPKKKKLVVRKPLKKVKARPQISKPR